MRRKPRFEVSPESFFSTHAFFRVDEFAKAYVGAGHSKTSVAQVLAYHAAAGRIQSVRRGLYMTANTFDECLLPSKLHRDAVLAYDGAAALHGLTEVEHQCCYLAPTHVPRFVLSEVVFRCIRDPKPLALGIEDFKSRTAHEVRATTVERTLVDCLDRIDLGPDVDELYEGFLRDRTRLDLDFIVDYVEQLKSAPAAMRVGLFLSAHPDYRRANACLSVLRKLAPGYTLFLTSNRDFGENEYWREWRLNVPKHLSRRMYRIAHAREPA